MKILISGGHLTPALAVIDYIRQDHPHDEIVFVGRIYSQEQNQQLSVEQDEIKQRQLKFIALRATKLNSFNVWRFMQSLARAYFKIMKVEKPDVFLSFGGFLALPLAIAAFLARVPVLTHEQTRSVGQANKLIARFAQIVALSFSESQHFFPKTKTVVTGNPIREKIWQKNLPAPTWFKPADKPLILVMGGNQGSLVINQTIQVLLARLLNDYTVIHACGKATKTHHYQEELLATVATLPQKLQARYWVREWLTAEELFYFYQQVQLVISRAGANTVYELATAQVPAILIPLPFAQHDEQRVNATWLTEAGAALMLEQEQLNPENLLEKINILLNQRPQFISNFAKINLETAANAQIYQLLVDLAQSKL